MKLKYLALASCAMLLSRSPLLADGGYQLTPIPLPPDTAWPALPGEEGFNAGPLLNLSHQVALTYLTSANTWQPYLWGNGVFTALALSPGSTSGGVTAINDSGNVVGYQRNTSETASNPVLWAGGTVTLLDQQGQQHGAALTINNNGQIGGRIGTQFGLSQNTMASAILWDGSSITNLGNYGNQQAYVAELNNNGEAIVNISTPFTVNDAVLRAHDGTITRLDPSNQLRSTASSINDRNQVIGGAGPVNSNDGFPFLWDHGGFTPLAPSFASDPTVNFGPYAINNNDLIVGSAGGYNGPIYAALWRNNNLYDLNSLIAQDPDWHLWIATDVADDGTIAGIGQYQGNWQAFMLTPTPDGSFDVGSVPEPATLSLLTLSALPLLLRRRSKGGT